MVVNAIDNLDTSAVMTKARSSLARNFDQLLSRQNQTPRAADNAPALSPEDDKQLRKATEQLVASAFILPLLQQIRQDPFKSDLFHGGSGEETFGQLLDTQLADRMVTRSNFPLVEAIYNELAARVTGGAGGTGGGAVRLDTHG